MLENGYEELRPREWSFRHKHDCLFTTAILAARLFQSLYITCAHPAQSITIDSPSPGIYLGASRSLSVLEYEM